MSVTLSLVRKNKYVAYNEIDWENLDILLLIYKSIYFIYDIKKLHSNEKEKKLLDQKKNK